MRKIEKTPHHSKKIGNLPKGCQQCVKGEKLVLYITGVCPRNCFYCPLSEKKKNKDVIFVNEWKTDSLSDALKEAKISKSKGMGITGGDPLSRLDRTITYINAFKKKFGKSFHIHLYTSLNLVSLDKLQKLYDDGLNEIRFHPDFEKKDEWKKIELAKKFDWDVGIEIPLIPEYEKEILELCDYIEGKVDFLNLNEFEMSDLNSEELMKRDYELKEDIYHGIKGSIELGEKILEHCINKTYDVHMCSSTLKDRVQMQNRFKLRAKSVKTKFDIITEEGLLLRGVIYVQELTGSHEDKLKELKEKAEFLEKEGLEFSIDENKLRLITYPEHVEQFKNILKEHGFSPAIIEEDPTVENFEVNKSML
jgi:hypothetical protein